MAFADQAKAAMDAVVAGPTSELVTYTRQSGEPKDLRIMIDDRPDLLGVQSEYGVDAVVGYVSKTDLDLASEGDRVVRFRGTKSECPFRVDKVLEDDEGGFTLYLVR